MNYSHKGTALITGASSGIGAEFARQLAQRGYQLILVARRTEKLESLAAEVTEQHSVQCEIMTADLSREADTAAVAQKIRASKDLTMLVNNAGFGTIGEFADVDLSKSQDMVKVHILATITLISAALPHMLAVNRGDIINVSSVAGFMYNPGSANYSASKAYINVFSKALAAEVKEHGLRIQALCPGFTYSEFHEVGDFDGYSRDRIPKSWWMSSKFVVGESLKGLKSGKVIVIPRLFYRMVVGLYRFPILRRLIMGRAKKDRTKKTQ